MELVCVGIGLWKAVWLRFFLFEEHILIFTMQKAKLSLVKMAQFLAAITVTNVIMTRLKEIVKRNTQ